MKEQTHWTEERKLEYRRAEFAKDTRKQIEELRSLVQSCFKPGARQSSDLVDDINYVGVVLDSIQDELHSLMLEYDYLHEDDSGF